MNKKLLLAGLSIFLLIVLAGCGNKPRNIAPVVGSQAPDFSGTTLDGKTVTLKDLEGKQTILCFWWAESPAATRELTTLNELKAEQGSKVEVLTINAGDDQLTVDTLFKEKKYSLPVILDDKKVTIVKLYRIDIMPTTFLLDKQGLILKKFTGGTEKSELISALENK